MERSIDRDPPADEGEDKDTSRPDIAAEPQILATSVNSVDCLVAIRKKLITTSHKQSGNPSR